MARASVVMDPILEESLIDSRPLATRQNRSKSSAALLFGTDTPWENLPPPDTEGSISTALPSSPSSPRIRPPPPPTQSSPSSSFGEKPNIIVAKARPPPPSSTAAQGRRKSTEISDSPENASSSPKESSSRLAARISSLSVEQSKNSENLAVVTLGTTGDRRSTWSKLLPHVDDENDEDEVAESPPIRTAKINEDLPASLIDPISGKVAISCDIFEKHHVFGNSQCRICGIASSAHFKPESLLSQGKEAGKNQFSWPLVHTYEGYLWVLKRNRSNEVGLSDIRKMYFFHL